MNPGAVNYDMQGTADEYVCANCGASGCKLWREYQTFLDHQVLRCAVCAAENQVKGLDGLDRDGFRISDIDVKRKHGLKTDQIGWLVPAVPTEEGDTFWGYCAVPPRGVAWWRRLPNLPDDEPDLTEAIDAGCELETER